jgi:hypothetical protein
MQSKDGICHTNALFHAMEVYPFVEQLIRVLIVLEVVLAGRIVQCGSTGTRDAQSVVVEASRACRPRQDLH